MNLYQSTTCTANSHIYELKRRQFHSKKIIIISSLFDNYCFFFLSSCYWWPFGLTPEEDCWTIGAIQILVTDGIWNLVSNSLRRTCLCHHMLPYVSLCPTFKKKALSLYFTLCFIMSYFRMDFKKGLSSYFTLCPSFKMKALSLYVTLRFIMSFKWFSRKFVTITLVTQVILYTLQLCTEKYRKPSFLIGISY